MSQTGNLKRLVKETMNIPADMRITLQIIKQIIFVKLKSPGKENVVDAIKQLEKLDFVRYAEPNSIESADV